MNEDELKKLWQNAGPETTVDFDRVDNATDKWQARLRRKVKIDIAQQIAGLAVLYAIVWFYPKLFFTFWVGLVLAIWYISEILRFSRYREDGKNVREMLATRLRALKGFVKRTRVVGYALPVVLVPAGFYALGFGLSSVPTMWPRLTIAIVGGTILTVLLTEFYFRIFYRPSINELGEILKQLEPADEG